MTNILLQDSVGEQDQGGLAPALAAPDTICRMRLGNQEKNI